MFSWAIFIYYMKSITISMLWSNFWTFFSPVQWVIIVLMIFLWIYVWIGDVKERRIKNYTVIFIWILWVLWNLSIPHFYTTLSVKHFGEILFIIVIGYLLFLAKKIGAWDIKLTIVLALFFLIWKSSFIMIGNIASITLICITLHIIILFLFMDSGGFAVVRKSIYHWRMKFFHELRSILHGNFQSMKKLQYQWIDIVFSVGIILIVWVLQFFLERIWIAMFPFLIILSTGVGKISFLLLAFYVLKKVQQKNLDIFFIFLFFFAIASIGWANQNNALDEMLSLIKNEFMLITKILILFFIIRTIFSPFIRFTQLKKIATSELKIWDNLDLHTIRKNWDKRNIWSRKEYDKLIHFLTEEKTSLLSEKQTFIKITRKKKRKIYEYKNYFIEVYIQKTLPYGIYILLWFFFTFFSDINISKNIISWI